MTFLSYKRLQLNVAPRFLPSTDFLKQNKGKLEPDGSTSNSTSSRSPYQCPLIKIVSKVLAHLGGSTRNRLRVFGDWSQHWNIWAITNYYCCQLQAVTFYYVSPMLFFFSLVMTSRMSQGVRRRAWRIWTTPSP